MSLEFARRISVLTPPGGEQLAALPSAAYERLVAAADVAVYDEAKRRFAAGEEAALPADFAKRLIGGENPVRMFCELRSLSQKELAARARARLPRCDV
jgi:hypothetical protein